MRAALLARLAVLIGTVVLAACDAPHSEESEKAAGSPVPPPVVKTVTLTRSADVEKLQGVATILSPDPLLQIDADIRAANVAVNFSRGQLDRFRTSTLLSKQMVEQAVRQEGLDASQLRLVEARLRQTWGDEAPFLSADARQHLITAISSGTRAIVRLDFMNLAGGRPKDVRVTPLGGGSETKVETLWPAPSGNSTMPGVSFFGLVPAGPGLRPGDKARLIADSPDEHPGVIIPNAAIVVTESKSWCYVETGPKTYERKAVSLDAPVDDGFLVRTGFEPGERVVVQGASILLAREAEPGSLDDDDDGPPAAAPPPASAAAKPAASAAALSDRAARRSDAD